MSGFLTDADLEYIMNLPDNEFNAYIDVPDGDISDVGDEDKDETVEIDESSQAISEAAVMNFIQMVEKEDGGETSASREEQETEYEFPKDDAVRSGKVIDSQPKSDVSDNNTNAGAPSTREQEQQQQQQVKHRCKRSDYKFRKSDFVVQDTEWKGSLPPPPVEEMTPLQYYKIFMNDDIFELIAEQSNIYALQKDSVSLQTSKNEMEQFVGILLHMGIIKMPSIHLYWSNECRYSPIADVMSRTRFFQLLRYFHVVNNQDLPEANSNRDKLFKIRPLLSALQSSLKTLPPEEYQAVDEQIIPFKGRSGLKQYIRNKPHKWGYKSFTRAGASGMMYDFEIYVGKNTCSDRGLGLSGDIVLALTETLPEKQHFKVFADSWFSSIPLAIALKERGIEFCGTIRTDRLGKCPLKTEAELKKTGRGSCDWRVETTNNVALVRWFDRKCINFVSTYACVEPLATCRRYSASEKKFIDVPRPYIVEKYNKHMGGVDLADMLIELYRINLRSRKWYMRIVYWCLSVAVVNGWLLHRRHMVQRGKTSKMSLLQFQANIAASLLLAGKSGSQKKRGRPSSEMLTRTPAAKRTECNIESEVSASVSASSKKLLGAAGFPSASQMRDNAICGVTVFLLLLTQTF
ncbi:piggyBac transposable element-derived protein 3-like [Schistocerca nitens]|uniref:piggyBac transposable element-derived protein 3-like n=1 Tax=Schistocerca nitens TaxID=7011 RepID=UPI002119380E|nr:piggyBac transposable element-derived protein 3-like [Schistocerca nitens]